MAEQGNKTALSFTDPNKMSFVIREFDTSGDKTAMEVPMPTSTDFSAWTIIQQVGMLKRGPWKNCMIADIYWGLAYAHKIGADVMLGELFPTGDGRWGTSNKFKIKEALRSGKIKGFDIVTHDTGEKIELTGCIQKTDLECTVTLEVEGLNRPIIRKAKLSRWFMGMNPNWKSRPEHMLELNTFAHACEYVTPGGTGEDEAPPLNNPSPQSPQSPERSPRTIIAELKEDARLSSGQDIPSFVEEPSLLDTLHKSVEKVEADRERNGKPVSVAAEVLTK
jgi:hypothetical protein